jgi:hypothetical protein
LRTAYSAVSRFEKRLEVDRDLQQRIKAVRKILVLLMALGFGDAARYECGMFSDQIDPTAGCSENASLGPHFSSQANDHSGHAARTLPGLKSYKTPDPEKQLF